MEPLETKEAVESLELWGPLDSQDPEVLLVSLEAPDSMD